jgi:hypothetical protein
MDGQGVEKSRPAGKDFPARAVGGEEGILPQRAAKNAKGERFSEAGFTIMIQPFA